MSTLLPITPPRMPPAAAPMMPPFSLSLLVAAPMTAPAAAPIAASRFVFFFVTTRGSDAAVVPLLELLPLVVVRRAGAEVVVRRGAGATAAGAPPSRRLFAAAPVPAFIRSAAVMESSRAFGFACAASDRSLFNAGSAGLSLLQAAAIASAGARMIVLILERIVPPGVVGSRRDHWSHKAEPVPHSVLARR